MRLLLAEDEQMLSEALKTVLEHNGYSVDAVYNGRDALDYLNTGVYDGAILDIMMPKMDGLTVLGKIRGAGNKIPVLILTAKTEVDDRVAGLDMGADDYLTKPFEMKELLARIRAMLRRQPAVQEANPRFSNLVLVRADCTLSGPEGRVRLANKEFQMMEMLMTGAGRPISAERFLERIWGYDANVDVNVVWVNLSGLRRKMESLGAKAQIRSARGIGYMLEEIHD